MKDTTVKSLIGRHALGLAVTLFGMLLCAAIYLPTMEELAFLEEPPEETPTVPEKDPFENVDFNNYYFLDGVFQKVEPSQPESEQDKPKDPSPQQEDPSPEQVPPNSDPQQSP